MAHSASSVTATTSGRVDTSEFAGAAFYRSRDGDGRPTEVRTSDSIGSRGGMIGDGGRMAMRYSVRRRWTQRTRMGGLTWSRRSNPRPRKSRDCVIL